MVRSLPRLAAVLLVVAALAPAPASAAAWGGGGGSAALHAIWQPLAGLWSWLTGSPAPRHPRPAAGCSLDPYGRCVY